jgi:hypothetical protein
MGLGLSFHAEPEVAEELASGHMVRVLPQWSSPPLSVDVLMPARKRQPTKIRMTLDALRRYLDKTRVQRAGPHGKAHGKAHGKTTPRRARGVRARVTPS